MTRRDDDTPTVEARPGREIRAPVPAAGATLERFREIREIARGGMGRVVEAFDRHLGRTVAVKQSLDDDPATRLRFEREVAITARLEHPSIVPVYDAGVLPSGEPFYVMRKVTGVPLDRLIRDARVNGTEDYIEHMKTGILVPPQDPDAIRDAVLMLVRNEELRLTMGRAARDQMKNNHLPEHYANAVSLQMQAMTTHA